MTIVIQYVRPPIPTRDYDYSAIDDDTYDGAPDAGPSALRIGRGSTAEVALRDLAEQYPGDYTEEEIDRLLIGADETTTQFLGILRGVLA